MTQLNEEILAGIVERYKEVLPRLRSKSLSKWEAVKQFQIAWDPSGKCSNNVRRGCKCC